MKQHTKRPTHKLGVNRKEYALKGRRRDANFKQSKDVREDRGERQLKVGLGPMTIPGKAIRL